jgi:hypothetical protein
VVSPSEYTVLCEQLLLDSGPGPTVRRALSPGQDAYFAMVVQCSLLANALQPNAVAAILWAALDEQAEQISRTTNQIRTTPSEEQICGVLRACQEQTVSYPWRNSVLAMGTQLGIQPDAIFGPLPPVVLSGFVKCLPMVQQLRENRIIHAEIGSSDGVALLVVWAHQVLGLTVSVHQYSGNDIRTTTTFGSENAQVIIDVRSVFNYTMRIPSFTLLQSTAAAREELFKLVDELDTPPISGISRMSLKNYGTAILKDITIDISSGSQAVIGEMVQLITAHAINVSKHLVMVHEDTSNSRHENQDSENNDNNDQDDDTDTHSDIDIGDADEPQLYFPLDVHRKRIIQAARLIFGPSATNDKEISDYTAKLSGQPLDSNIEVPRCITTILKRDDAKNHLNPYIWDELIDAARHLSLLILALSNVEDLTKCAELPLLRNIGLLSNLPIEREFRCWPGKGNIAVSATDWFQAIACLILENYDQALEIYLNASLVSEHGWSIYLSSFVQPTVSAMSRSHDPWLIQSGQVRICKGVPCRKEVRKHFIVDGPDKGKLNDFEWMVEEGPGSDATLRCASVVQYASPYYGERQDSFVVTLRLINTDGGRNFTRRTGYFELFKSIWCLKHTIRCSHDVSKANTLKLEPGYVTVSGFGDNSAEQTGESQHGSDVSFDVDYETNPRVMICLTANDPTARWRALISILTVAEHGPKSRRAVLLRGSDCCFQCAVDQVSDIRTKWYVVL